MVIQELDRLVQVDSLNVLIYIISDRKLLVHLMVLLEFYCLVHHMVGVTRNNHLFQIKYALVDNNLKTFTGIPAGKNRSRL